MRAFVEPEGGSITTGWQDGPEGADLRRVETVLTLPDRFAASPHAAPGVDARRQRRLSPNA